MTQRENYSRMTQDGEPQAKKVKESGDNEEKNYDSELLEAAKVLFWPKFDRFSRFFGNFWQI